MKIVGLSELPAPPEDRTGWPWTEACEPLLKTRADGSPWPRISIVTPSFNQAQFLEETIRSVLLQGYPNLEYFVIDGGSMDASVDIIQKYSSWITYWVSERDAGQADAINKGLSLSTGEIFQFINSDDFLAPNALKAVASAITDNDAVAGVVINFNMNGEAARLAPQDLKPINFILRPSGYVYHQPGVWLRTSHVKSLGGFDLRWRYKFDWLLQFRYLERWPRVNYIDDVLVHFRLHCKSKTISEGDGFWSEELAVRDILYHSAIDRNVRSAIIKIVKRRYWRLRVDELVSRHEFSRSQAIYKLLIEAVRDPFNRIDRYYLGALRRLLISSI